MPAGPIKDALLDIAGKLRAYDVRTTDAALWNITNLWTDPGSAADEEDDDVEPTAFINDLLYWEGKFHQNNISYNSNNVISYDGDCVFFSGRVNAQKTR
ncbi:hypothetical protein N7527_010223 [Penicillium freii]|nr:hypothetical protein N7527_010223 [Penicillium freii]